MFKKIRKFIERGRKGYCYEDLWSFYNWLSKLIASGLKEFKLYSYTYPHDLDDWDEWMKVIDEMIECFEEQGRKIDNTGENFLERYKKRRAHQKLKLHRGLELLEKYWYDLWD